MKKKSLGTIASVAIATTSVVAHVLRKKAEKNSYSAQLMEPIEQRKQGVYEKYVKRGLDVACATGAIVCFCPFYLGVAALVKLKLGSPVLFTQDRPGMIGEDGKETIFKMYKFRTMTDERDKNGELLPDDVRLTEFGAWLRSTSLDELPEAINILNGTMSVVGPRPQLIRDMVFMSKQQRERHTAKPGLSGLAQVRGRNAIDWDEKITWDLNYINCVSFANDIKIILKTIKKAFIDREGINEENMATAEDLGDYLLRTNRISKDVFNNNDKMAKNLIDKVFISNENEDNSSKKEYEPFSVVMSVYENDNPDYFRRAIESITIEQTIQPDEIVLVIDGPIDKELDSVIHECVNNNASINLIRLPKNSGLGNALKVAVENAKNNIIARMDSDDISVNNRFEQELNILNKYDDVDIVGGNITEFIGDEQNIVSQRVVPQNNSDIRKEMKKRCAMNHVSVMFRKNSIQVAGGYDDWFFNEDYYLWIRMWLNDAKFMNTGTDLVNVRIGKDMFKRRGGKKYFESEKRLQKYMLEKKMISKPLYCLNVSKRFFVQRALPESVRGWFLKTFARS